MTETFEKRGPKPEIQIYRIKARVLASNEQTSPFY